MSEKRGEGIMKSVHVPSLGFHTPMSTFQTVSNTRRHAHRPVPLRQGDIHPLLKAVRTTYRAQRRPPQYEPRFVQWTERLGRLYADAPDQLAGLSADEVLQQPERERSLSTTDRAQVQEVLTFLQVDVLQSA
jgi:hypothetical protein